MNKIYTLHLYSSLNFFHTFDMATSTTMRRPATDFMFVNIARPQDMNDRKTRKRINSHVMKPIGAARRCHRPGQIIRLRLNSAEATPQVAKKAQIPALSDMQTPNPVQPSEAFPSKLKLAPSLPPYERPTSYPMSTRTTRILHFC